MLLIVDSEPVALALEDEILEVLWVQGRQDSKEVLAAAGAPLGVRVWEVLCHTFKQDAHLVEIGH